MKQIINRKKYDTETAREMARFDNGCGHTDFDWYREVLYQKKNGEFFLYGEGNARSPYSVLHDDGWFGGGEDIIPLTEDDARDWVERNCDGEKYEEIFGEVEE